jgi:hypothetical protein
MTEPATTDEEPSASDGPFFCYRHPDRETWVRCGRCDRPICTKCAMQGPVGLRCIDCGKPAFDPLTSLTPGQAIGAFAIALIGGLIVSMLAPRIGFFGLILAFFGGGLTADMTIRMIGFKAGPAIAALLLGGIAAGALVAFGFSYGALISLILGSTDVGAAFGEVFSRLLLPGLAWAAVYAAVICAGAWQKLR